MSEIERAMSAPSGGTQAGVLEVLRAPQAARLLAASLIGRLPLGAAPLALLLFARETMTLAAAGVLVGAFTVGTAIGAPLLARLIDRWRQLPVMWAAATISTAGYGLAAAGPNVATAIAGALLAGAGAPPFEASLRVLWRHILRPGLVRAAYSLDVASQEMIFVVGPIVIVAATAAFGPVAGLATTAGLQAIGTVLFTSAPAVRRWRSEPAPRHWAGPLRSGELRILLLAVALVGFGVGSVIVAATGYAEAAGSRGWAGWLLAAQATGALIGGLAYTRVHAGDERRRLPWLAAMLATGHLLLLLTPAPAAMLALMAVSGAALPPLLTATFLTVDSAAPAGTAAEAFAWVATAFTIGSAAGSALDGLLLDSTGSVTAGFALAPSAMALAAATLAVTTARNR